MSDLIQIIDTVYCKKNKDIKVILSKNEFQIDRVIIEHFKQ